MKLLNDFFYFNFNKFSIFLTGSFNMREGVAYFFFIYNFSQQKKKVWKDYPTLFQTPSESFFSL